MWMQRMIGASMKFGVEIFTFFPIHNRIANLLQLALFLAFASNPAALAADKIAKPKFIKGAIEMWERPIGDYFQIENPMRSKQKKLIYSSKESIRKKTFDRQTGKRFVLEVFPLGKKILASRIKYYSASDLVLLHFKNRMIIPVSLAALKKQPDALRLAIQYGGYYQRDWSTNFPPIDFSELNMKDPRPLNYI